MTPRSFPTASQPPPLMPSLSLPPLTAASANFQLLLTSGEIENLSCSCTDKLDPSLFLYMLEQERVLVVKHCTENSRPSSDNKSVVCLVSPPCKGPQFISSDICQKLPQRFPTARLHAALSISSLQREK